MKEIKLERNLSQDKLNQIGVFSWPIWEKEESEFPWSYNTNETCYILEGKVIVTPAGGQPREIQAGDFVRFPTGLSCTWKITQRIRKHYQFS